MNIKFKKIICLYAGIVMYGNMAISMHNHNNYTRADQIVSQQTRQLFLNMTRNTTQVLLNQMIRPLPDNNFEEMFDNYFQKNQRDMSQNLSFITTKDKNTQYQRVAEYFYHILSEIFEAKPIKYNNDETYVDLTEYFTKSTQFYLNIIAQTNQNLFLALSKLFRSLDLFNLPNRDDVIQNREFGYYLGINKFDLMINLLRDKFPRDTDFCIAFQVHHLEPRKKHQNTFEKMQVQDQTALNNRQSRKLEILAKFSNVEQKLFNNTVYASDLGSILSSFKRRLGFGNDNLTIDMNLHLNNFIIQPLNEQHKLNKSMNLIIQIQPDKVKILCHKERILDPILFRIAEFYLNNLHPAIVGLQLLDDKIQNKIGETEDARKKFADQLIQLADKRIESDVQNGLF